MKRITMLFSAFAVISLFFSAIWPAQVSAAAPTFVSLGQIQAEGLYSPGAMSLDDAGNLYVASPHGGKVFGFDAYGRLVQTFEVEASGAGVAVTSDGQSLYVARRDSVVKVDVASKMIVATFSGAEVDAPEFVVVGGIELDSNGNVFVVDAGQKTVKIYDAEGLFLSRFGGNGAAAGQFMQFGGMAINAAGQVVLADSSSANAKVHVFNMADDLSLENPVQSVTAYSRTSAANFGSPEMYAPRGMTFDSLGRGYILEFMNSQVRVVDAAFGFSGAYTVSGFEVGQLKNVSDVVFDQANSRLFVSCDGGRIEILGVDGGQNPIYANSAPTMPVPQSPVGNSEVKSTSPVLVVANATDADGDDLTYRVVLSRGGLLVHETEVAAVAGETTNIPLDGLKLAENATFSWTVQASDGEAVSDVSFAASFVVNAEDEAPTAPELVTPVSGEPVDGFDALAWGESTDPDPNDYEIAYLVEIAADAAFGQVVTTETVAATDLAVGDLQDYAALEDGASYFWRVVAVDQKQMASEPSLAGQFVYDPTILTVTANVPGARVSLGGNHAYAGQLLGDAPLELRDIAPGIVSLVVERPGFEPYVASVNIVEQESVVHYAALVPAAVVEGLSVRKSGINGKAGFVVNDAAVPFVVDFNNDGQLDLLIGDASGQIFLVTEMDVLRHNKMTLKNEVALDLPVLPGAVPFVVDWNNDGRKDLLVGLSDGTVSLFLNNGSEDAPAFAGGQALVAGMASLNVGFAAAPAVMDVNGNGLKDLVVGNGAGQVLAFLNVGTDSEPQLAAPVVLFSVAGAAVPMPVDWDADGQQELLVTAAGASAIYAKQESGYAVVAQVYGGGKRTLPAAAAFPVDLDGGNGKELLVGAQDGQLILLSQPSTVYVAAFQEALLVKVYEVAAYISAEAPELLTDVSALRVLIEAADYATAGPASAALAAKLPAGPAQTGANELAELCN